MKIVRTTPYTKALKKLGASAGDVAKLEASVAANPEAGGVVPGLGVRKIRFAMGGKGKRGGGRAIYYAMVANDVIFMLYAYSKAEREDLSNAQKKAIAALLKELE